MSSAMGQVKFKDGTIKYFRYDGTGDICVPFLSNTRDDCWEVYWRKEPVRDSLSECELEIEPVEIAVSYGKGMYWSGFASKEWISWESVIPDDYIIDKYGDDVFVNDTTDGLPKWWEGVC